MRWMLDFFLNSEWNWLVLCGGDVLISRRMRRVIIPPLRNVYCVQSRDDRNVVAYMFECTSCTAVPRARHQGGVALVSPRNVKPKEGNVATAAKKAPAKKAPAKKAPAKKAVAKKAPAKKAVAKKAPAKKAVAKKAPAKKAVAKKVVAKKAPAKKAVAKKAPAKKVVAKKAPAKKVVAKKAPAKKAPAKK